MIEPRLTSSGIVLGACVGIVLSAIFGLLSSASSLVGISGKDIVEWITVGGTVGAVIVALFVSHREHKTALALHQEAKESKAWAARARLPDALSAISAYTRRCARYLAGEKNETPSPAQSAPADAMEAVKNCIEHIDPTSAKKLYELVEHYQINNARLEDLRSWDRPHERTERLYDVARLRALTDRLFGYARGQHPIVPDVAIDREQMLSALRNAIGIPQYFADEGKYTPVVEMIEQRHPIA